MLRCLRFLASSATAATAAPKLGGLSAVEERRLSRLAAEVKLIQQTDHLAPEELSESNWRRLLALPSPVQRIDFLHFLGSRERRRRQSETKKANRRAGAEQRTAEARTRTDEEKDRLGFAYAQHDNSILIRRGPPRQEAARLAEARLVHAMAAKAALRIVFDLHTVTNGNSAYGNGILGQQLNMAMGGNRDLALPARLAFANCHWESPGAEDKFAQLARHLPALRSREAARADTACSFEAFSGSVSTLYPKAAREGRVVVLSKTAEAVLDGPLDEETVYVIPAVVMRGELSTEWGQGDVDQHTRRAEALASAESRARRSGFQLRRLPLERYLAWQPGATKTMPLNHISLILSTVHANGGDWEAALKAFVPRRKWDPNYLPEEVVQLNRSHRHKSQSHKSWILSVTSDGGFHD